MERVTQSAAVRAVLARVHELTAQEEARAWRATLQMASPAERRGMARAAWLDLRAYGYTQEGQRQCKR